MKLTHSLILTRFHRLGYSPIEIFRIRTALYWSPALRCYSYGVGWNHVVYNVHCCSQT